MVCYYYFLLCAVSQLLKAYIKSGENKQAFAQL